FGVLPLGAEVDPGEADRGVVLGGQVLHGHVDLQRFVGTRIVGGLAAGALLPPIPDGAVDVQLLMPAAATGETPGRVGAARAARVALALALPLVAGGAVGVGHPGAGLHRAEAG